MVELFFFFFENNAYSFMVTVIFVGTNGSELYLHGMNGRSSFHTEVGALILSLDLALIAFF